VLYSIAKISTYTSELVGKPFYDLGVWPAGDGHAVSGEFRLNSHLGTIFSTPGNLYGQAVDLGNIEKSYTGFAIGNSMTPGSEYFRNLEAEWANGTQVLSPMGQSTVEATADDILELVY
jgi:hypothetical protein